MRSLYEFIVKPKKNRYNNTVDVDGEELIVNSNIDSLSLIHI